MKISKSEELRRLREAITITEKRIATIERRTPELQVELDQLIVTESTHGYKASAVRRVRGEIQTLRDERETLTSSLDAYQRALPALEREARIESAATETVAQYEAAKEELRALLLACPSLTDISEAVSRIEGYNEAVSSLQSRFLTLARDIGNLIIDEELSELGSLSESDIARDRTELTHECGAILRLSEAVMELGERLNELQFDLFSISTRWSDKEFRGAVKPQPDVVEKCACGNHRRVISGGKGLMYELRRSDSGDYAWEQTGEFLPKGHRPVFPCERPPAPKKPREERERALLREILW